MEDIIKKIKELPTHVVIKNKWVDKLHKPERVIYVKLSDVIDLLFKIENERA